MSFNAGDLVRVISPSSLEKMKIVGIVTTLKYPSEKWFEVWIPDLDREMCFLENQLKKLIEE